MIKLWFQLLWISLVLLCGCGTPDSFPHPRAYPRIDLPLHAYKKITPKDCPFSLNLPVKGELTNMAIEDSCKMDVYFPGFEYYWHFTYRNIPQSGKPRRYHEEEYLKLVMKHAQKLDYLNEQKIETPNGWGTMYELKGHIGSPVQLLFGDSTHLIMTSFYFQEAVNQDSLKPLIVYVTEELEEMVRSVEWK